MKRKLIFAALIVFVPVSAFAAGGSNVGSCGWGSKLFNGQSGPASQVMAVTTNGTSGNQTFGISSGTSGCTQNGVVHSNWKTAMFIRNNKEKLARDMSTGQGEALDSLAQLIGVSAQDKPIFDRVARENFSKVFASPDVTAQQIMASIHQVMQHNDRLARYAQAI